MGGAGPGWIATVRALGVRAVAERLGLRAVGKALAPCPACGAERRGSADKRPPVGVRPDDAGWRCLACDAHGDAVSLAAAVYKVRPGPELRARLVAVGLLDPPHGRPRPRAAPPPLPPPPPRAAPPARLDPDEVARVWTLARPVWTPAAADPRAWPWLRARGLDWAGWRDEAAAEALVGAELAGEALARVALPDGLPDWARVGPLDWARGYPLVLPCYDAAGRLVALRGRRTAWREVEGRPVELRARAVWSWGWGAGRGEVERRLREQGREVELAREVERRTGPAGWHDLGGDGRKEVSPRGEGATRGTVYACPVGRAVLRGEVEPGDAVRGAASGPGATEPVRWSGHVLVVEGGADYLRRAVTLHARNPRPAVFGAWSGAWPDDAPGDELAAALRSARASVRLMLDPDEDGDGYARNIAACLARASVPYKDWRE